MLTNLNAMYIKIKKLVPILSVMTIASGLAICNISYPHLGTKAVTSPQPAFRAAPEASTVAPILP